ncbi:hypothetical protein U1Q18_038095 [Sarracenia purpurea var. burkii]
MCSWVVGPLVILKQSIGCSPCVGLFEGMGSSSFGCIGVADYLLLHFVCSSVPEQLGLAGSPIPRARRVSTEGFGSAVCRLFLLLGCWLVCCWFFSLLDGCVVLRSISCAVVLHPQFCCSNFAGSVFLVGWLSSSCCLCVRWLVGFLVQQFCRLFRYNNSSFAATDLLGPLCGVLVFSVWCCWMLQVLAAMSCAAAWLWCSSIVRNWWRSLLLHCLVLVASSRVLRSSFGRFPFLLSVAPLELQQL